MKLDYDTLIFLAKTFNSFTEGEPESVFDIEVNQGIQICVNYIGNLIDKIHTKENAEWHKAKQEEPPEVIQELEKLIKQQMP